MPVDNAHKILDIYAYFKAKPGHTLISNHFLAIGEWARWPPRDLQDGIEEAHRQGWVEEAKGRAVFLSDLTGDPGHQLTDVRRFRRSLIAHNTVLYQTDFASKEWAFRYYLRNALFRLDHIDLPARGAERGKMFETVGGSAKDDWSHRQAALDSAIANFDIAMFEHDPK